MRFFDENGVEQLHEVTGSHPYYVKDKGWVEVIDLEVGDQLLSEGDKYLVISSLFDTGEARTTYNFEVKDIHTYYVGASKVLVHNCTEVTKRTEGRGSPALKGDPYSPSEVNKRQSQRRRDEGVNADPDTPLPDRGPGGNIKDGVHTSEGKVRHSTGERNVASKEEHSIKQKGNGRGIH